MAIQARNNQRKLILPKENTAEAALVKGIEIIPAVHLLEICAYLNGQKQIPVEYAQPSQEIVSDRVYFSDVHGLSR